MKEYLKQIADLQKELKSVEKRMLEVRSNKEYDLLEDERNSIVWDIRVVAERLASCCTYEEKMYDESLERRFQRGGSLHTMKEMMEIRLSRKNK